MKTPYIAHLTEEDYEHVYEPAEDSFILLDALEQDAEAIRALQPSLCIEIGSGSGVVSTFLGQILDPLKAAILTTDINALACAATARTAAINAVELHIIRCNLVDPLCASVHGKVDILLFNPPYVPTTAEELKSTQLEQRIGGAWAGGDFGMTVTDQVLGIANHVLADEGRFYLVAIEQNDPNRIIQELQIKHLHAEIILRRRAGRELLYVIRAVKSSAHA